MVAFILRIKRYLNWGKVRAFKMNKTNGKWHVETRKQRLGEGGRSETTEKVKVLYSDKSRRIIEAIVLTDIDIDRGGNKTIDRSKGYHYIALMDGKNQLSFAIDFRKAGFGWRVLSDDCLSFRQDVTTKKAAIDLLAEAAGIKEDKVNIADQAWRQEQVPSEEEIRAEQ